MKKLVMALLMSLIVVTGCSSSSNDEIEEDIDTDEQSEDQEEVDDQEDGNDQETEEDKVENEDEGLTLQVLKIDEEAGVTIENNEIYSGLEEMIAEDPTIGADNDFTVRTMDIYNTEDGSMLIMLGINRVDVPLKDISFDLTLGDISGEYVWEDFSLTMSEEDTGILQPDSAVPILMNLSEEEEELLRSIDQDSLQVIIENFDADFVE